MTARYTGYLRKENGAVVGQLADTWGWIITLTATPSPEGGYVLTGTLGEIPPSLRVPLLDDPEPVA